MNNPPIHNQELMNEFYAYYKSLDHAKIKPQKYLFQKSKRNAITYKLFTYLTQLLEYDEFPQVIPNRKFNNLSTPTLYRGVEDIEYLARYLVDYDYHFGNGFNQNGIYACNDKHIAKLYAKSEKGYVLPFKLAKDTKVINASVLLGEIESVLHGEPHGKDMEAFSKFIKSTDDQEFLGYILKDASILAMLFGFEAVIDVTSGKVISILNRQKVIVPESEFKAITSNSRLYKNGVIDFQSKKEEDFLRE